LQNNSKVDLDQVIAVDMNAKRVLEVLAEFKPGELVRGEQIQQKTGFSPETINGAVKVLEKSLFVQNPDISDSAPPYDFKAVAITDFGRQVLEQYG
jgi:hypothetical protein